MTIIPKFESAAENCEAYAEGECPECKNGTVGKEEDELRCRGECGSIFHWPEPTMPHPTVDQLEEWMVDSICEATDGCAIEQDGVCEHGHPSWFLYLGVI